jgi:hypothetical protein
MKISHLATNNASLYQNPFQTGSGSRTFLHQAITNSVRDRLKNDRQPRSSCDIPITVDDEALSIHAYFVIHALSGWRSTPKRTRTVEKTDRQTHIKNKMTQNPHSTSKFTNNNSDSEITIESHHPKCEAC